MPREAQRRQAELLQHARCTYRAGEHRRDDRPWISFKENELVVSGVTGALEFEIPFFRRMEDPAGELPVHQIHLLALVAVGLDAEIFGAAADALHLAKCGVE